MSVLFEAAVEGSLVLLAALLALPLLRRQPAALRHGLLACAIACAAAAPLAARLLPPVPMPLQLASVLPPIAQIAAPDPAPVPTAPVSRASSAPARAGTSWLPAQAIAVVWLAGTLCALGVMAFGLARIRHLARAARPVASGPWAVRAAAIAAPSGLRQPVTLLQGTHPSLLVTWGIWRPKVLLPAGAATWADDRVHVTLCHEFAHVHRRDWPVLVAAEAVKAVYWFNPLVWLACARLRQEAEQACDDAVIVGGIGGTEYAAHLVNIARELKPRPPWLPAHGVARPSSFERRIRAMLDPSRNRRPVSRAAYAVLGLALAVLSVSIAAAAQQRLSTVSGSIADATNGTVPGVTVQLTNVENQSKFEVRTDALGRYEFVGVPAGEYLFEARLPGFMTFRGQVTVSGPAVERNLTLALGSLAETVVVMATTSRSGTRVAVAPRGAAAAPGERPPLPECGSALQAAAGPVSGGVRVGGNIRAPRKLRDVKPLYPASAAEQGVEGIVVLSGCIGADGRVSELNVDSADAHPDLAKVALDAVWQWEFTPTLLNGTPMPIAFTATVEFRLRD